MHPSPNFRFSRRMRVSVPVLLACLLAAACGRGSEAPKQTEAPAVPAAAKVDLASKVTVTFTSGEVSVFSTGTERPATIGDELRASDVVATGEGSTCELQFGRAAVVKLSASSRLAIASVSPDPASGANRLELATGNVLCKVAKLSGDGSFTVRTQSAICGVRGTEFGVRTDAAGTRVTVREGSVVALPKALDIRDLADRAGIESGPLLADLERAILASAPVVTVDQELAVGVEVPATVEILSTQLESAMKEMAAKAATGEESGNTARIEASTRLVVAATALMPKPAPATESSRAVLAAFAAMGVQETEPVAVEFVALPTDADILENGAPIARGRLRAFYPPASVRKFRIERAGYAPRDYELVVPASAGAEGASFTVELEALPKKVNVKTVPADAEIVRDGNAIGVGSWTGELALGAEAVFEARKAGFASKSVTVSVGEFTQTEYLINLERDMAAVAVRTKPADAVILIGAERVGKGSFDGSYPVGDRLSVTASLPGYKKAAVSHTVSGTGNELVLELEPASYETELSLTPADASVSRSGAALPGSPLKLTLLHGERAALEISRAGYATETVELLGSEALPKRTVVKLERERAELSVTAEPADAFIELDGKPVGSGSYRTRVPVGDTVKVLVRRKGYEDFKENIVVTASQAPVRAVLAAKILLGTAPVSPVKLVSLAPSVGGSLVAADRAGTLYGLSSEGATLWSARTANDPNENGAVAVSGGKAWFTGTKELVAVSVADGAIAARSPLPPAAVDLFGRRPVVAGSSVYLTTNEGILSASEATGAFSGKIPIEGGSLMTPVAWGSSIVLADQEGKLLIVDCASGSVVRSIPTSVVQSVAQAPRIIADVAYFAGRKGHVAAVDLAAGKALWAIQLPGGGQSAVYQDLACSKRGVYAFAKKTVFALDAANGAQLFAPVEGAVAPPVIAGDLILVVLDKGRIVALDGASGAVLGEAKLPATASAAPVVVEGVAYVPLADGRLSIVSIEGLKGKK